MLTKRISVSHLCHDGGFPFPLRASMRSSQTWADGWMNDEWEEGREWVMQRKRRSILIYCSCIFKQQTCGVKWVKPDFTWGQEERKKECKRDGQIGYVRVDGDRTQTKKAVCGKSINSNQFLIFRDQQKYCFLVQQDKVSDFRGKKVSVSNFFSWYYYPVYFSPC